MSTAVAYEGDRPVRVDFRRRHTHRAVVFIHGFLGRADTTWGDFPHLLMHEPSLNDWDVFGVGYNTGLRMDITGLWAHNADLRVLGYYLRTTLAHSPLDAYSHLALIAHSMGGLVAQHALIDDRTRERVSHLILFGTPSAGARKAIFARHIHAQARDMSEASPFISALREAWADFLPRSTIDLRIVAAEQDAFVPPSSSLSPFPESVRYVVPGSHSSMVKPKGPDSLSFQIVLNALVGREPMMGLVNTQATHTFLFTSIEGSTERWERHPAEMSDAAQRYDAILRQAIRQNHGAPFKIFGDRFCSVFDKEANAVQAAVSAQLALGRASFEPVGGIHVRMALNNGLAEHRQGDYFGPTVNRVGRLLSIANGGQIIASAAVVERAKPQLPPEYCWRDLGVHRLKDLVEPESVFQVDFPGLRVDFPPLSSLGTLPNNLPAQATPLVGRRAELGHITELVRSHPVVTLVGTGGIGKTRAAVQVGSDLLDSLGDGVWFVDLAALTDPQSVAATIAATLGVREQSDRSVLDTLLDYLQRKHLLLILDNCEHVIEAVAAATVVISGRCTNVSILATSREPLRVAGEHVFRMPSLAVPPEDLPLTAESAPEYGAIALFVQAAVADDPSFRLTDETTPVIADICRQLDGIALAIELAAVRVRVLTPRRLAERLDDRLRILTAGRRGALPRQQTLRALIDWSHGLLSEKEQRLFRRLGIFAGGWTLDAAEAVCADDTLDQLDIVDLLLSLAEKSLVVTEQNETPRFRMLESLRAFAAEKLASSDETTRLSASHARWIRDVADRVIVSWTASTPELDDFEREIENARVAIDWALSQNEISLAAVALVGFAAPYQKAFGYREFQKRLRPLLDRIDEAKEPALAAYCWRALAATLSGLAKIDTAQRALALAERCDDARLTILVLVELAFGMYHAGRGHEAQVVIERALRLLKDGGLGRTIYPFVLNLAGVVANENGRYEEARRLYTEALSAATTEHENAEAMAIRSNMAENEFRTGHPIRARELIEEVEADARSRRSSSMLVGALQNGAGYRLALGDFAGARRNVREALPIAVSHAFDMHVTILIQHLATVAAHRDDPTRGARLCGYADAWYRSVGMQREYSEQYTYEILITALRATLQKDELAALLAKGANLSQQEAVSEALAI
jgi:predicted ATPase/class 3 adenylate cyclase